MILEGQPNQCERKQTVFWLVVSTPLKNISQNGNLPQIGVKINNIENHHLVLVALLKEKHVASTY